MDFILKKSSGISMRSRDFSRERCIMHVEAKISKKKKYNILGFFSFLLRLTSQRLSTAQQFLLVTHANRNCRYSYALGPGCVEHFPKAPRLKRFGPIIFPRPVDGLESKKRKIRFIITLYISRYCRDKPKIQKVRIHSRRCCGIFFLLFLPVVYDYVSIRRYPLIIF